MHDLGDNRFSGVILEWIGENLTYMAFSLLGANTFSGNFPEQVCQLHNLHVLDFSRNSLLGPIPKCLGNFEFMKSVSTISKFPPSIEQLSADHYVDLTVKGRQYEYSDLLSLINIIDLSSNNLSGEIPKR
ncbi:hypothetical protein ACE6H2_024347 [Prunus campanulata]